MNNKLCHALYALIWACSSHVHAEVTASVQVAGLAFSVVDLRPEDGVAPSISFFGGPSFLQSTVAFSSLPGRSATLLGVGPFADLQSTITVETVRTRVFIDEGGGAPWSGATLYAEGYIADAANSNREFSSSVLSDRAFPGNANLLLSPYTQLEVTITATLFAAKTSGPFVGGNEFEVSVASATIGLRGPSFDNSRTASINLSIFDPAQTQTRTTTFSAFARNNTDQPMPLYFNVQAAVDGRSTVSVVPEPETWALWAAGIGILVLRVPRLTRQHGRASDVHRQFALESPGTRRCCNSGMSRVPHRTTAHLCFLTSSRFRSIAACQAWEKLPSTLRGTSSGV